MLPLRMKLELTSPGEPAAARLQPHACTDEIKQEIVFDVGGADIFNYNSESKKAWGCGGH